MLRTPRLSGIYYTDIYWVYFYLLGEATGSMLLSKLGSFSHIPSSMDLPAKLQLQQGKGENNDMPGLHCSLYAVSVT